MVGRAVASLNQTLSDNASMLCWSASASGMESNAKRTGCVVPAVMVRVNRRCVCRFRSAPAGMSIFRSSSPGSRMFALLPVTKSTAPTARSAPVVDCSV